MTKTKVLFIGNYLSGKKGTTALAFRLKEKLGDEFDITLASHHKNKMLRLLHIIGLSCFHPGKKMIVDVYSGQAIYMAAVSSFIGKYLSKKKIIFMLRGGNLVNFYDANTSLVRKVFSRADDFYTPSQYLQAEFTTRGYTVNRLANFVDLSRFHSSHHQAPSKLLWVRSFKNIYHPEVAIAILHSLHEKGYPCTLTMVGPDDGMLEECRVQVNALGLDKYVTFTGPILNEQLPKVYQAHGIYLNTTSYESFGNALLEAAASGLVCVSNAVGEIPYMWKDGENMFLVKDNQVDEFVDRIIRLHNDENLFRSISNGAQENSKHYDWEQIKPKWMALLNE